MPGLGRFPEEEHGNPLQYSCLENSMDRGAWGATVHWVIKSCMIEQLTLSLLASSLPPEFSSGPRRVCTVKYLSEKASIPTSCSKNPFNTLFSDRGHSVQLSSVHSFSRDQLFVNPWTAAYQATLSIINSQSLSDIKLIRTDTTIDLSQKAKK